MDAGYLTPDLEKWNCAKANYEKAMAALGKFVTRGRGLQQVLDDVNAARDALLELDAPDLGAVTTKAILLLQEHTQDVPSHLSNHASRLVGDLRRLQWHYASD